MSFIKKVDREKIYPFNIYDTIYVAKPILIKDIKENRRNKISCDCLEQDYPQIIFLFMKNGKLEKYIVFPDDRWHRHNFTDEEHQNFDWSEEKERMIQIFK